MIIHKKMRRIKSIRTTQNFDNTSITGKRKINDKMVDAKTVTWNSAISYKLKYLPYRVMIVNQSYMILVIKLLILYMN